MRARRRRISLIFGTRPEAIKLCPLALALVDLPRLEPHVCVTGQHRELLDPLLATFGVAPHADLALMQPNQTLADLTSRTLLAVDRYLAEWEPDLVIIQGDTTTAFAAALASFYRRTPVGHVEAGLRTRDKLAPFPEEINRVLASRLVDWHFAPTLWAADNLLAEGVEAKRVVVTGNTGIDALRIAVAKNRERSPEIPGLAEDALRADVVLVTGHRRESFGGAFEAICLAIAELATRFRAVSFVYPVHLNPNVREPVFRILGGRPNVHLIEPLDYLSFVALMQRSRLILTDSGGVQEEAPSLGKPVLVMREKTERPEGVEVGSARLVGVERGRIVDGVATLLTDAAAYARMARATNPYGDGRACERIVEVLAREAEV